MKIRMKQTQLGAADGVTVISYEKGVEYELGESARALDLALVFIGEGWADEVSDKADPAEVEAPPDLEEQPTPQAPAGPRHAKGRSR